MVLSEYETDLISKINSLVSGFKLYYACPAPETPLGREDQMALFVFLEKSTEYITLPDPETIKSIYNQIDYRPKAGLANPDIYRGCQKLSVALFGYRAWSWSQRTPDDRLYSMYNHGKFSSAKIAWEKGWNQARCHSPWGNDGGDILPHGTHDCGLNSFNYLQGIKEYLEENNPWRSGSDVSVDNRYIVGAVIGAGQAQVHANGWRSEKGAILALLRPAGEDLTNRQLQAERCAQFYSVPLFDSQAELEEYVETLKEAS